MNDTYDNLNGREPLSLSDGFDATDRELDSLLADLLSSAATPAGLSTRVYNASARLLTGPAVAGEVASPLRLVGTRRQRQVARRRVVSRLAMAASVALACAVGLKVCLPGTNAATATASEADWAMFEQLDSGYASLSQLVNTRDMTLHDVTSELTMLAASDELEM